MTLPPNFSQMNLKQIVEITGLEIGKDSSSKQCLSLKENLRKLVFSLGNLRSNAEGFSYYPSWVRYTFNLIKRQYLYIIIIFEHLLICQNSSGDLEEMIFPMILSLASSELSSPGLFEIKSQFGMVYGPSRVCLV